MGTPVAIIIGGALIGAAILFVNHWQIVTGSTPMRVNKWTGEITVCQADQASVSAISKTNPTLAGVHVICERPQ